MYVLVAVTLCWMAVTCMLDGCCMHVGWLLHVCWMAVTCMLNGCYMYVEWLLHVCWMACDLTFLYINCVRVHVISRVSSKCRAFAHPLHHTHPQSFFPVISQTFTVSGLQGILSLRVGGLII